MSPLPRAPHFLLAFDAVTIQRPSATVDSEGNAVGGRATVFQGRGTLVSLRASEELAALQRGTRIDKALSLPLGVDVRGGDFVTAAGTTYEVVELAPMRLRQRALLRIVA